MNDSVDCFATTTDELREPPLPSHSIRPVQMSQRRYAPTTQNTLKLGHSHAFPGTISVPRADISAPNFI